MSLADQLQQLYARFGQLPGITIELQKELVAIAVHNKGGKATVFLQGAQVAEYTPAGERPVLWLGEENRYLDGTPLRGGIPVCWPWFGDLQRNPEAVKAQFSSDSPHGFVRKAMWQLDEVECLSDAETRLRLSLPQTALTANQCPPCDLQLELVVGSSLSCQLVMINRSDGDINLSAALHTYLAVSDVRDIAVEGLGDCAYIDTLKEWSTETQQGSIEVAGETDRIYLDCPQTITLKDPTWQRQLTLTSTGSQTTVVWNPWTEKAKRLSDFADDDYLSMMCLETANALEDCVTLSPGSAHTLGVTLAAETIAETIKAR
ncbi:D-hexose-6-phosphate mutarotase [Pseudomaricurvus sp. HS19]|uniref:D-hexose-6-phosphate mutarotase n=1 Tax=Pseudomaricurvus sp. HS19 TaxID=2692626 RepID=UPI00136CC279|nr:D-hexose-6-phosphate mutarotase [Pseudomaricurvus sp. HS19]MYM64944.1 D-hexose-6-phosphate mutarotase [Pseudomaricurvus sp. HS19]